MALMPGASAGSSATEATRAPFTYTTGCRRRRVSRYSAEDISMEISSSAFGALRVTIRPNIDFAHGSRRYLTHVHVRLRRGIAGLAERVADRPVRVEIDLPVMRRVAVRPHGEDGAALVEGQYLDVRLRFSHDVRNLRQHVAQATDGVGGIHRVVDLREEVHATKCVVAEILDRSVHDLAVAHHRLH